MQTCSSMARSRHDALRSVSLVVMGPSPIVVRPVVSSSPSARFMHWIAAPAVPLVRLSIAPTATSRPARSSAVDLQVDRVGAERRLGLRPFARGEEVDERLLLVRARRTRRARPRRRRPAGSGAVAVARMPRDIGASTGVKLTRTRLSVSRARFCSISGVWRWTPTPYALAEPITSDAEQVRLERLAGARRARHRDDDDVGGVDQTRRDGRCEGQRRDRRVAAWDGDPARPGQRLTLTWELGQTVGP